MTMTMTMTNFTTTATAFMLASIAAGSLLPVGARAQAASELWPEPSAFVQLNEVARMYLDASFWHSKESNRQSLNASAFLDLSIQPMFRPHLSMQDRQRS